MPLYDYQCTNCQKVIEVRHGFNDSYAERCSACGGELRRLISPAPIIFKGSGFYVTDSRKKESTSSESSTPKSDSPSAPATPSPSPAPSSAPSKESAA